jgi:hypothetical protein
MYAVSSPATVAGRPSPIAIAMLTLNRYSAPTPQSMKNQAHPLLFGSSYHLKDGVELVGTVDLGVETRRATSIIRHSRSVVQCGAHGSEIGRNSVHTHQQTRHRSRRRRRYRSWGSVQHHTSNRAVPIVQQKRSCESASWLTTILAHAQGQPESGIICGRTNTCRVILVVVPWTRGIIWQGWLICCWNGAFVHKVVLHAGRQVHKYTQSCDIVWCGQCGCMANLGVQLGEENEMENF